MTETATEPQYRFAEVWFRCVTPLHLGIGQDVGIVDLPVARERTTGYPFIPGSGLRGALRERFRARAADREARASEGREGAAPPAESRAETALPPLTDRLFGPEEAREPGAGCVSVLDARLLFFPVRCSPGIFCWVTCSFVLNRYQEDRAYFLAASATEAVTGPASGRYWGDGEGTLYLEEFRFEREESTWNPPPDWPKPLVLIADEAFGHFAEHATLVRQRNRLTTVKTVARGQLFTVEAVPPEAIFYGFLGGTRERRTGNHRLAAGEVAAKLKATLEGEPGKGCHLILGGEESVGMGMTHLSWRS